jgi:hypothetical protein
MPKPLRCILRVFAGLCGLILAGCAMVTTQLQSTWVDPTYDDPPFRKIAVLAMFETAAESRNFERSAVEVLAEREIAAVEGHVILDAEGQYEEDEMKARLLEAATDGVLIFRQIAIDERDVYEPPGPYLEGIPRSVIWSDPYYWYYYPHWNYYWHWRATRDVTRASAYWARVRYVIVETSLYDGRTDRLVWTAKSATMDPEMAGRLAESIVTKVTRQLMAEQLVAPAVEPARVAMRR